MNTSLLPPVLHPALHPALQPAPTVCPNGEGPALKADEVEHCDETRTPSQCHNRRAVSGLATRAADVSRIIEMAWEDRTPFEALQAQFGLNEAAVIQLMRTQLKRSSFKLWRQRVQGRATKHAALRPMAMNDGHRHQARHRIPQR
jgi:uncharacterized protein (TIGR03643 family)